MEHRPKERGPKPEFMQGYGFPLYVDTGHELLTILSELEPAKLSEEECHGTVFLQLAAISRQLMEKAKELTPQELGVTRDDMEAIYEAKTDGADIFENGFANLEFPFHFIPALMQDTIMANKERLGLTLDELCDITMADFASLLREKWFQDMLTGTARTGNGQWRLTGDGPSYYMAECPLHYNHGLTDTPQEAYDTVINEGSEGAAPIDRIASISLSRAIREPLTDNLRATGSVGCPVAAKNRTIDPHNPHAKKLEAAGYLELWEKKTTTVGHQIETPVERSARVLADFINKYLNAFGEPAEHYGWYTVIRP